MSFTANFELGTNGADVLVADPGSATPWDARSVGAQNAMTYDRTRAAFGSQSAKVSMGNSSGANSVSWVLPSLTNYYGRDYRYFATYPGGVGTLDLESYGTDAGQCWAARVDTSGIITLHSGSFSVQYTFTNPVALNQWVRLEYHAVHATNSVELKLFNNGSSSTPTEVGSFTGQSIRGEAKACSFGAGSLNFTYWMDEIVAGATSYPGPITADVGTIGPRVERMRARGVSW